jgi:hypothetical protein
MDLGEMGWGGVDWIGLAQKRDKWKVLGECGNDPSGSVECWEFSNVCTTGSPLSRAQLRMFMKLG